MFRVVGCWSSGLVVFSLGCCSFVWFVILVGECFAWFVAGFSRGLLFRLGCNCLCALLVFRRVQSCFWLFTVMRCCLVSKGCVSLDLLVFGLVCWCFV